jgi:AraC family L-rhamnose operon regulatory protein RhaS
MAEARTTPVPIELPDFAVMAFESVHAAGFASPTLDHAFWKLLLCLQGSGAVHTQEASWPTEAGTLLVVPAETPHHLQDTPDDPMTLLGVCFGPAIMSDTARQQLPVGPMPLDPLLQESVHSAMRRIMYEQSVADAGYDLMMVALAKQLMVRLMRRQRFDGPRALPSERAVRNYIDELGRSFFEAGDLDQAAARTGLSRRRFTQLFRQVTGCTHHQYIQQLRIAHAKTLLRTTDRSITSVAFECGFGDLSSFYRAFTKHEHCKPSQFRHLPGD